MTTTYEPMDVTIERGVDNPRMSGPVPAFDPTWARLDQMRWWAGYVRAQTGITVGLNDGSRSSGPGYSYEWPELVGVSVEGLSMSLFHSEVDDYLKAFADGAAAMRRKIEREAADAQP